MSVHARENYSRALKCGCSLSPRALLGGAALALGAVGLPQAAMAQQAGGSPQVSAPVVQALPSREAMELNAALSKLARNPRDVVSLIEAGESARKMGDFEAAVGFFKRAEQIESGNPKVKAGLARALVNSGDPFTALPLFDEAAKAGVDPVTIAADRGLAHDLVGDNAAAQNYYRQALAAKPGDNEISRRLALSLSISGQEREVERILLPMLRDQDKAAWRARAFSLAILGKPAQAVKITGTLLPPRIAEGIAPYLEYMPRLTRAQQAAAANLGKFPRASEIGIDDPRVAAFKPAGTALASAAGDGLSPKGAPLGKVAAADSRSRRSADDQRRTEAAAAKARREAERRSARVAPPEVQPLRTSAGEAEPAVAARTESESPAQIMARATPASRTRPAAPAAPKVAVAEAPAPKPSEIFAAAAANGGRPVAVTPAPTSPVAPPPAPAPAAVAASAPATAPMAVSSAPIVSASAAPAAPAPSSVPAATAVASAPASILPPTVTSAAASAPVNTPEASTGAVQPGFDLARLPASSGSPTTVAAAAPPATPAPVVQPVPANFSSVFEDLGKPQVAAAPAAGAVDIRKIVPRREAPPEKDKLDKDKAKDSKKPAASAPSHPSRIWVQIGIGQDKAALAGDWRRFEKRLPDAFKGLAGHVSKMNQTNRLLAGPFESQAKANAFIGKLDKGGVKGPHIWTSPAGQVVDRL